LEGIKAAFDIVAPLKTIEVRKGHDLKLAPGTLEMMEARHNAKPGTYCQLRNCVVALVISNRLRTNLAKPKKAKCDPKALWDWPTRP